MSVDKNNQKYKKTSFLTGVNSDYIEEYYSLYLQNSKLLTNDWIEFFDGLKEDSKNILQNIILENKNNYGFKIVSEEKNNPFDSIMFLSDDSIRSPRIEIINGGGSR